MSRVYELRQKEVINIRDGGRFGFVTDFEVDHDGGKIKTLIIPGPGRMFGMFGRDSEYRVPWEHVKQIGDDLILIDCDADKVLKDIDE